MKTSVIIVGAGKGERLGGKIPKCLRTIEGVPLILVSAFPFYKSKRIDSIVMVVPPGRCDDVKAAVHQFGIPGIKAIVEGGEKRQDSVRFGLKAVADDIDRVLIHDGARPFLSEAMLECILNRAFEYQAATIGLPVIDTLHELNDNLLIRGADRTNLVGAQTPQVFVRSILENAYELADQSDRSYTDEISLVRDVLDIETGFITGEISNIKITHPDDLRFYHPQLLARVQQMKGL